jgi:hypothetical protein
MFPIQLDQRHDGWTWLPAIGLAIHPTRAAATAARQLVEAGAPDMPGRSWRGDLLAYRTPSLHRRAKGPEQSFARYAATSA